METVPEPTEWPAWRLAFSAVVGGMVVILILYAVARLQPSGSGPPFLGGPVGAHLENPGTTLHMVFEGLTADEASRVRLYFFRDGGGRFWVDATSGPSDIEGDLPSGTYRVVIPAEKACSTCDPDPVPPGPLRCQGTVEIGAPGSWSSMTVTFAADGSCAIESST